MSDKALATLEQIAIADVKSLANIILALREDVFKEGHDFGKIPGTGEKPTLLLPGMEKLMRALHLRAEYVERSKLEDFENSRIYYRYECRLIDYKTGECVATAIGSANSLESKWRWREAKRVCPKCGKDAINRSKFAPRGAPKDTEPGWYCYAKIGGCGAEFSATDPTIINQQIGRVENPDIFDQMNTIDKIAQKRALSSAIKGAANVSEFFTVDIEDFQSYDTTPPVVMIDDGRDVDTVTGEVAQKQTTPLGQQPAAHVRPATDVITFDEKDVTAPVNEKADRELKSQSDPLANLKDVVATDGEPDPLAWVDELREETGATVEPLFFETKAVAVNKKDNRKTLTFSSQDGKLVASAFTREPIKPLVSDKLYGKLNTVGFYELEKPIKVFFSETDKGYRVVERIEAA